MTENSGSPTPALLVSYIDRLVNVQTSILELQRETAQLRQDARADKFNMEAVFQLGLIVSKSPHDKGVRLLTDILRYAHQSGIKLDTVVAERDVSAPAQVQSEGDDRSEVSNFRPTHILFAERYSVIVQFALGVLVAGSFIWLLR